MDIGKQQRVIVVEPVGLPAELAYAEEVAVEVAGDRAAAAFPPTAPTRNNETVVKPRQYESDGVSNDATYSGRAEK